MSVLTCGICQRLYATNGESLGGHNAVCDCVPTHSEICEKLPIELTRLQKENEELSARLEKYKGGIIFTPQPEHVDAISAWNKFRELKSIIEDLKDLTETQQVTIQGLKAKLERS